MIATRERDRGDRGEARRAETEDAGSKRTGELSCQQNAEAEQPPRGAAACRPREEEVQTALQQQADEIQALLGETPAVAEQLDGARARVRAPVQELPGVQQQAARGGRAGEHRAAPEGRAVPRARVGLRAARADLAEPLVIIVLGALPRARARRAASAMLLEAIDPLVRTTRASCRRRCGIPVLASIPQHLARVGPRGAAPRAACARRSRPPAGRVFALVGGAGNYVWVNGAARDSPKRAWPRRRPRRRAGAAPPDTPAAVRARPRRTDARGG